MSEARRYEILETLGRGGFGTFYRARQLGEGGVAKQVALKVLDSDVTAELAARMRDEARILGLIRHRSVVLVDGVVQLNGRWTLVMEYIQGLDLARLMRGGPIPAGPACEIIGEVAAALHTAYASPGPDGRPLRLVHRDIKPVNIHLTAHGAIKLLEFGAARHAPVGREAEEDPRFGSTGYTAPERLDGGPDESPGDVYALGVVLFEVLAGRPFGPTFPSEIAQKQALEDRLRWIRDKLGPKAPAVTKLLADMLAYAPAQRPSARDVERRCGDLRVGESLRDWAERTIPPMLSPRKVPKDGLTGAFLTEGTAALAALEAADAAAATTEVAREDEPWERSEQFKPGPLAQSSPPAAADPKTSAPGSGPLVVGSGRRIAVLAGGLVAAVVVVALIYLASR